MTSYGPMIDVQIPSPVHVKNCLGTHLEVFENICRSFGTFDLATHGSFWWSRCRSLVGEVREGLVRQKSEEL